MTPAEILVGALRRAGSDTLFGVPGGGPSLALIGAAEAAGMRFVLSHGETAAAITAATYGLLSGAPAAALATRGPGATSAVNGVAQATLDRYPLVMVTDCVPQADVERVAHQRIDQIGLMSAVAKWSGRLGIDAFAAETAGRAVELARAAPQGAVHLDLDPTGPSSAPPTSPPAFPTGEGELLHASALLVASRRPVVVAGLGCLADPDGVRRAIEVLGCPTLTTYQSIGLLPEGHRLAAGLYTGGAVERALLDRADLVIALGLDTVEPIPAPWAPTVPVVAIDEHPPASSFIPATVELRAPLATALSALAQQCSHEWPDEAGAEALAAARRTLRAAAALRAGFGPMELVDAVVRSTPARATVTVDAGAHFLAVMPFWPAAGPQQLLISNGLATMGFALPAAIGAALARPGQPIVCLAGDGGFGMVLAELETVARLALPITVVVFDDAALSLIEIKQATGQGGTGAVRYAPVDFAAVARAMGIDAVSASSAVEVERCLAGGWDRPRLVDARIDPAPYRSLMTATRG